MVASRLLYLLLVAALLPFAAAYFFARQAIILADIGIAWNVAVVLLFVVDLLLTERPHLFSARRVCAERFSVGRPNQVLLLLSHAGRHNLSVRVKDDFPNTLTANPGEFRFTMAKGESIRLGYEIRPGKRGRYEFGNINVSYRSFLKLFAYQFAVEQKQKFKVYVDLQALKRLSVKLSAASEVVEAGRRRHITGTEFSSLREYSLGDDMRSIDWKATARRDRPIVCTYETEHEQRLFILVDAGRTMSLDLDGLSRFDHALNAAAALSLAALYRNDQVGLCLFADKPLLYLMPRRGPSQLRTIIEAVSDISPRAVEPDYAGLLAQAGARLPGRSLVVLLTDLVDAQGSALLLAGIKSLLPRHLPFCVSLRDRQIDELAGLRSLKPEDIYRRAAAQKLVHERNLLQNKLLRQGCLVLDVPPQELSESLVERYLSIKARGLL